MNLTNKLFSLLGFAEPIPLKRYNKLNLLPENILLVNLHENDNTDIEQVLIELQTNISRDLVNLGSSSLDGMVIDATSYIDTEQYQRLYSLVKNALIHLAHNAKVIIIAQAPSPKNSIGENTFSQALVGFCKSLAKEIGRKGSSANILFIADDTPNKCTALFNPIKFFLSSKSAFISGQALTINNQNDRIALASKTLNRKKVAVITGAAQGIGASIASKLYNEGYLVIGIDIEPMKDLLINAMNELKGQHLILDVCDTNAGEQLATLARKHDGIDLMVHNAGITRDKTLAKMPAHFWQQTIDINLLSVMRINDILLEKHSINHEGRIICLSSMNGIAGQGGQTNYACSKAGIIGYVKSMSATLAKNNITINAVAPGFIETQMTEQMPFFTRELGRRLNALGQSGLPVDVAEAVAFLGDDASFAISGQTLRVCGLNIMGR